MEEEPVVRIGREERVRLWIRVRVRMHCDYLCEWVCQGGFVVRTGLYYVMCHLWYLCYRIVEHGELRPHGE